MNARGRNLVAAAALGVPVLLGVRALAVEHAFVLSNDHAGTESLAIPAHMSGSAIDLWVIWAVRNALVPAAVRVGSGVIADNERQQEGRK
jgi:hypothetical protein